MPGTFIAFPAVVGRSRTEAAGSGEGAGCFAEAVPTTRTKAVAWVRAAVRSAVRRRGGMAYLLGGCREFATAAPALRHACKGRAASHRRPLRRSTVRTSAIEDIKDPRYHRSNIKNPYDDNAETA
jgi:hypothetical protein